MEHRKTLQFSVVVKRDDDIIFKMVPFFRKTMLNIKRTDGFRPSEMKNCVLWCCELIF